jgi:hypothetical protein
MPLISDTIRDLVGGVSQQSENLRFSNTASEIENAYLSPVVGMQKRQATEWLGELYDYGTTNAPTFSDKAATHFINRDATEHYCLVVDADGLRAFDADTGQALRVETDGEAADIYLTSDGDGGVTTDFAGSLRFATVADTTFVVNKNVTIDGGENRTFEPHHFAAYPQLAYDVERGGTGGDDGAGGTSANRQSLNRRVFRVVFNTPTTGLSYVKFSNGQKALVTGVSQSAYFSGWLSNVLYFSSSTTNPLTGAAYTTKNQGNNFVIPQTGVTDNYNGISYELYRSIFNGGANTGTSPAEFLSLPWLSRQLIAADATAETLDVIYPSRTQGTFGPNGSTATINGRTIVNDLQINAQGVLEISDDAGATYRALRINDHSSWHTYSGAARRAYSNPDVDFDNLTSVQPTSISVVATSTPGSGGPARYLWKTGIGLSTSEVNLINDIIDVITGEDTESDWQGPDFLNVSPTADAPLRHLEVNTTDYPSVATFQDLSAISTNAGDAAAGQVRFIGGDVGEEGYYVIADQGQGKYIETYRTPYIFDETTLPHKIQRLFEEDGTPYFSLTRHQYAPRVAGNNDSNAVPSFVGSTINDVFVHGGRLGFVSDENMILSGTDYGSTSNFFRSTVVQLLDSDRIDISMSTGRVDVLQSAVPFANTLMLMSDRAQFRLIAPNALTPATALLQQAASIEASALVRPVSLGTKVFFPQDNVSFTTCMEITSEVDTAIIDSTEITAQAPKYIPSGVHTLCGSQKKQMLFALSHNEPNNIFVYKFFEAERNRLQSAWSKWTLGEDTKIIGADVIEDYLHIAIEVTSKDYIAALEASTGIGTSFGTTSTRAYMLRVELEEIQNAGPTDFPILLDMKVSRSQCVTVEGGRTPATGNAYDPQGAEFPISTGGAIGPGSDWSAIELPYRTDATDFGVVLTDTSAFGITVPSVALTPLKLASNVTLAQFDAAQLAFIGAATVDPNSAATTAAYNALAALIDSTMNNTRALVYGRLDGVFATDADRVLNNITTAVLPNFSVGMNYTMAYTQSPIFYKPQGAETGRSESRLQLRYATVTFSDTAGFTAEITPKGRQQKEYVFGALQTGDADVLLGQQAFATGSFRFPIFAKNDSVTVKFTNDGPFPSTLTTLEWQGMISPKSMQA